MTHLKPTLLSLAALPLLVACSGGDVEVVEGRPEIADPPSSTHIATDMTLTHVVTNGSAVLAGSDAGLFAVNETTLAPVDVVAYEGEPAATGSILALSRRDGGALAIASEGVYHTFGDRLVRSPASDMFAGLASYSVDSSGSEADETVWLGSDGAVYQLHAEQLSKWSLGTDAPVTAVRQSGDVVLAAAGERLFELGVTAGSISEFHHDFGAIADISRGAEGDFLLATASGPVLRHADGGYTRYTLSDDGSAVAATASGFDSESGAVFSTAIGIIRIGDAGPVGIAPAAETPASALAVDLFGDVWLAQPGELTGLFVGEPLSFAGSVMPLAQDHCATCHAAGINGAPEIDFTDHQTAVDWSDRIVDRVTDPLNPMPPKSMTPLSTGEIDTFVRWYATGTAP